MPLKQWNPATRISRGNVSVGIIPALVNMDTPTMTELGTGTGLDCAIQNFNGTSSTDSESVDWLCNPSSEQLPGSTTHEMDDLVIKGTGQADEDLINSLNIGDVVYIWRRDGIQHDAPLAAAQRIWVWKVIITSIDPLEGSNTFIGITAHITVMGRTATSVAIAA
jgi:hypothetical protein